MKFINKIVNKVPWLIIAAVILVTIFFGYHALQVEVDTDIKEMFPQEHPALETFEIISEDYGGAEYIIALFEDKNIIKKSSLKNIKKLTTQLEDLNDINKVRSITNIEEIKGKNMTIDVTEFMENLPRSEGEVKEFKKELQTKNRYLGSLVGEKLETATVIAQLGTEANQQQVVEEIDQILQKNNFEEEIYLTGSPVLSQRLGNIIISDIIKLLPLVSLMVLVILFLSFKSLRGTILPIIVVLFSVIWTVGLVSLTGYSLSQISSVLPVLLISVGSAYAIHFLARYYEDLLEGSSEEKAISHSIIYVGAAIAMAGITTMIGFASLGLSELTIIQEFGLFTTFGVFTALLLSTTFLPAVLLKLKRPENHQAMEDRALLDNMFGKLYYLVKNKYKLVLGAVLLIIILSVVVIPRIVPETNFITFFNKDSRPYQANRLINDKLGGDSTFEIIINSGNKNGAEKVEFLQKIKTFQEELEKHELLSNSMSVVELLEEANQAMHDGDEAYEKLPDKGVAQYYMLLSSGSNILEEFIDFDHREVRIRVFVAETNNSQKLNQVINYTRNILDNHFPEYKVISRNTRPEVRENSSKNIVFTGVPILTDVLQDLIISSQIKSLIAAVFMAFVVTSILLKSPVKGLACSFPIAFTVLLNFGIMGWTSITLNVATSMIASVAVGIGVDYGIHFYTRYLEEREKTSHNIQALKKAIFTIGRANFFNATAVIAGFLVLLLSTVPPLRTFGLLTSVTMLVSFLGAMVILPSILIFKEKVIEPWWNSKKSK